MVGDGQRLDHRGLHIADLVGQPVADVGRYHEIVGEGSVSAVVVAGDAEHLTVGAQIHVARQTGIALVAVDRGVEGDPVSARPALHARTDRFDLAGRLVSHDVGRLPSSR
ncbi:hypothetical protein SDC9_132533 [bioreactor metagenome]|uniref:Uncharacterized protein n=1 Tax=bioreactor metagenome TaxID=1076179 RepID=A0A645DA12_9ZZZZ